MKKNTHSVSRFGLLLAGALMLPLASQAQTLLWDMNETGEDPIAVDSSGENRNGTSYGNVYGGAPSLSGTAFSGFTSRGSYVVGKIYDNDQWQNGFTRTDWSFVTFIKNPDLSDPANNPTAFIARGTNAANATGGNVPWQIYLNTDGTMSLQAQSWNGGMQTITSDALTWNADSWYQIAVTVDYAMLPDSTIDSVFNIYITEVSEGATVGTAAISTTVNFGEAGLATGNYLIVGGANNGYYSSSAPGGYLGGEIDQTGFWRGTILSTTDLNSSINAFIPEPASYMSIGGVIGLGMVLLLRRRRR